MFTWINWIAGDPWGKAVHSFLSLSVIRRQVSTHGPTEQRIFPQIEKCSSMSTSIYRGCAPNNNRFNTAPHVNYPLMQIRQKPNCREITSASHIVTLYLTTTVLYPFRTMTYRIDSVLLALDPNLLITQSRHKLYRYCGRTRLLPNSERNERSRSAVHLCQGVNRQGVFCPSGGCRACWVIKMSAIIARISNYQDRTSQPKVGPLLTSCVARSFQILSSADFARQKRCKLTSDALLLTFLMR